MDEGLEKQAAEWFERGRHDIDKDLSEFIDLCRKATRKSIQRKTHTKRDLYKSCHNANVSF